ncbi:reverse transcriptase domain-containing protein [Tanacetum coccineum]
MKEMRDGCNKYGGPDPSSDCDDKPMGGPKEEEANYASGGYRGGYRGNYYGQNSSNWRDRHENRNSTPGEENLLIPRLPEKKPDKSNFRKPLENSTQTNPKPSNEKPYRPPTARNEHVNAVFTHSGKTYDLPANPNTKTAVFLDDNEDEVEEVNKKAEPLPNKPTQFLDMIKEVRINVPLVDVLAGMPNYGKFLKDLVKQISAAFLTEECSTILQNKISPKLGDPRSFLIPCKLANSVEYLTLADLGASINLMPYSLYAALSGTTLKPTRMSIRLANHTYQYPMGVAKNMLVQVGKSVFPVDFVILQMKEDDRVP